MSWHTPTVPAEDLASLLTRIRNAGGTVACSRPAADGVRVSWATTSCRPDHDASRPTSRR